MGVAKLTRPSTKTELLSHGAKPFGRSKTARLPEMCRGQTLTMWVLQQQLILLLVRARVEFSGLARHALKSQKCQTGAGKQVVKCEMCIENDQEGSDWERQ
jgi:hypothetical protein